MDKRLLLQALLEQLLGSGNVYFQPPADRLMQYPAIVYERDSIRTEFANNLPYKHAKGYMVTVIYRDPDSDIPDKISNIAMCQFSRHFVSDNLNHDVFNLYF